MNPKKAIKIFSIPFLIINLCLFVPNIFVLRYLNHERIAIYQDISSIVGPEATYSQNHDALG
ncbi:MAG: hypothetical protein ACTSWY_14905, partial [Promethearchaeota archaeon]